MKEISNKKRKKKGFTLIELIIVIAIIAIIGAIALPNFTKIRTESKTKADTQSMETIKRITQTLLIEDKVLPSDTFTVTAGAATEPTSKTLTADEISEYFKEVKKPQQDGMVEFDVTISDTGDVTVAVDDGK